MSFIIALLINLSMVITDARINLLSGIFLKQQYLVLLKQVKWENSIVQGDREFTPKSKISIHSNIPKHKSYWLKMCNVLGTTYGVPEDPNENAPWPDRILIYFQLQRFKSKNLVNLTTRSQSYTSRHVSNGVYHLAGHWESEYYSAGVHAQIDIETVKNRQEFHIRVPRCLRHLSYIVQFKYRIKPRVLYILLGRFLVKFHIIV